MKKENIKIAVIGAGISGLSTAHWLRKEGFNVSIFEKDKNTGGSIKTEFKDGYLIDYGPNSGLETSEYIRLLAEDLRIDNEMIYANEVGNKRYIVRDNKLNELPTSPISFIKTKLFSCKGKFRLFKEPFVKPSGEGYYQSLASFVERRLGKEFLDYAIDPFVSGVFAGDPHKLSVKSAFPKLYALEEKYGGLIKGMFKGAKERKKRREESKHSAKMFSFSNGMQTLINALEKEFGEKINLGVELKKVERKDNKYVLINNDDNVVDEFDLVVSSVPAYSAAKLLGCLDDKIITHLEDIYYPPVKVLYLGYDQSQILRKLDGFGFLIPSLESKSFLGAIWSSTIFDNRAPENKVSFTIFIGGARNASLLEKDNLQLRNKVLKEFSELMQISGYPELIVERTWQKAIPQYNLGYIEHENYFEEFEKKNQGIFLTGNYRGGISIGDCIKNSYVNFKRIKKYINEID